MEDGDAIFEKDPHQIRKQMNEIKNFLPNNPFELAHWLDAFDFALARRLCNLSYALNLELLKSGLINSLLPISLLETALRGQVEMQSSPSNAVYKMKQVTAYD